MARSRLTDEQVLDADFLSEGEYNTLSTTMSGHLSDQILTTSGVLQDQIDDITIGTGITDHGELTGLSDDDHAQYLLTSSVGDRDTFADSWASLTASGTTALHTHLSSSVDHNQTTNTHNLTTDINHNTITNTHQDVSSTASPTFSGILITNGATINGNLTVSGTTFTTRHEIVEITDNLLLINNGEVGDGISKPGGLAGIEIDRGALTNYQFVFDEASDNFKIGQLNSLQPVATRQDTPTSSGIAFWNNALYRFDTISNLIYSNNCLYINETSNAFSTVGITINQGAADDDVLTFKSSDVSHPFTGLTENDTYFLIKKNSPDNGGAVIRGFSDADAPGILLQGHIGNPSPTNAGFRLVGYKTDGGTGRTALASTEKVGSVYNATTEIIYILGNGDINLAGDVTINSDLADVTSTLTFGRTTGGNATATYSGTSIDFNKVITSTSDIVSGALTNPMTALIGRGMVTLRNTHTEDNIIAYGTGANAAVRLYASGGTYASPTDTLAGQAGFIGFTGYANSTYITGSRAVVGMYADTDWTASSQATNIQFKTTPIGSTTMAETMRLNSYGQLGIGISSFSSSEKLRVNGTALIGYGTQGNSGDPSLVLTGTSISDGSGLYGSYGNLLLSANGGFSSSERRFLITNALNANKFAIIRSVDPSTTPTLGVAGVVTSGYADFVINSEGQIGINTASFIGTEKLRVNGSIYTDVGVSIGGTYSTLSLLTDSGTNFRFTNRSADNRLSLDNIGTSAEMVSFHSSSAVSINTTTLIGTEKLRVNGHIYSDYSVIANSAWGFKNNEYVAGFNPIWCFANATTYGLGYYQRDNDLLGIGQDAIGFHFGSPAAPPTYFGVDGTTYTNKIKFPATQVASTDANTLDDYEEGSYTATIVGSTSGNYVVSSSWSTLRYIKIGSHVHVQGLLSIESANSPVGSLRMSLPFAVRGSGGSAYRSYGIAAFDGTGSAKNSTYISVNDGDSYGTFINFSGYSATPLTVADFDTSWQLGIAFEYISNT